MKSKYPLSMAERLWLYRRRNHIHQDAVAAKYGTTHDRVTAWERGREDLPASVIRKYALNDVTATAWERCVIARRRRELGVRALAALIGVSHVTLLNWERGAGAFERLVEWWSINCPEALP